ncbi:glycosyltransferase family 2 protein [Empedobacter stercoris]|uniref:Glycosyltransferase family 2 protein n=1 Tax=Empedobacter stercoris TaxID=1628248 RepID=A0ABX1WM88_9FLAO|nr:MULTISPECIES: glycosyltransferase family 2 protein [Empedobacter]HJD86129.1 glycosyltransferase family 2 protein [Empedobacter falsenii]MCA4777257.1 glycosyltransferase family 2 protein [Empedobacter stercoris]MCA4780961.1 glycosyltransferase family 2 protein [Empedobacter stercoris]MCA4808543.1 glycosyltransferase family 2 protein [Empedobacter stercoris]MDM1521832.1 glycosyltransferase family 2 protein [Empedobacter sp. 225-1]
MNISVVVPLLNEQDSLEELFYRIKKVCEQNDFTFEVIFVDDGSTDDSWQIIEYIANFNPEVKGIKFRKNYGKSPALSAAFKEVKGDVVITMDADLQDFPEEIPSLYKMLKNNKADIVSGWKENRQDNKLTKNLPSKLFNGVARKTSGVKLHDFNCGLKAYRWEVTQNIELYGDMHRYIPVLAKNAGYSRIIEKKVKHQARKYGVSKFGANRFVNGFLDLITLFFASKFGNKPMHIFGLLGTLMFILGFFASFYLGIEKLYKVYISHSPARLITDSPYFYISLVFMILGTQLFLAGFLGELIVRNNREKQLYLVQKELNLN